jgi:UDP-glucose:(heptosyl)LPS alpha-1,3-glucosyltransferase
VHGCLHRMYEEIEGRPMTEETSSSAIQRELLAGQRFGHCIANSELMKADFVQRYALPPERISVVYPGYDPQRFAWALRAQYREPLRRELGIPPDALLAGLIASGDFRKRGVDILLQALARLSPASRDRLYLLVMGKDRLSQENQALVREAGMQERVRTLASRPDVHRYYHALDIFAFPCRFEEFGQVLQEAMVCGVPVIAPQTAGAMELYGREAEGIRMERPEPGRLAQLVDEFIARPELRDRFGELGRRVATHNTWDYNFERTYQVCLQHGLAGG